MDPMTSDACCFWTRSPVVFQETYGTRTDMLDACPSLELPDSLLGDGEIFGVKLDGICRELLATCLPFSESIMVSPTLEDVELGTDTYDDLRKWVDACLSDLPPASPAPTQHPATPQAQALPPLSLQGPGADQGYAVLVGRTEQLVGYPPMAAAGMQLMEGGAAAYVRPLAVGPQILGHPGVGLPGPRPALASPFPRRRNPLLQKRPNSKPQGLPAERKEEQFLDVVSLLETEGLKEGVWCVGHQIVCGCPMPGKNYNSDYLNNIHGKKFAILSAGLRRVVNAAQLEEWGGVGPTAQSVMAQEYDWDADNWIGEWLLHRGARTLITPEQVLEMIPTPDGRHRKPQPSLLTAAGVFPSIWVIVDLDGKPWVPPPSMKRRQLRKAFTKWAPTAATAAVLPRMHCSEAPEATAAAYAAAAATAAAEAADAAEAPPPKRPRRNDSQTALVAQLQARVEALEARLAGAQ